jgi:predicted RNase H-like HicB family nuclease
MIVPVEEIQVGQGEDGLWIAKSRALPGGPAQRQDRAEALLRFQHAARAHLEGFWETGLPLARLISPLALALGMW